jgi:hypothetical protein
VNGSLEYLCNFPYKSFENKIKCSPSEVKSKQMRPMGISKYSVFKERTTSIKGEKLLV